MGLDCVFSSPKGDNMLTLWYFATNFGKHCNSIFSHAILCHIMHDENKGNTPADL